MNGIAVVGAVIAATLSAGCTETTDGTPMADQSSQAATATTTASSEATPTPTPKDMSELGVVETTRRPLEPNAQTCEPRPPGLEPGTQQVSFVQGGSGSQGAPVIGIVAPATWKFTVEHGSPVMVGTGTDGMTGSLTVVPTDLGPAAAFDKYADDVAAKAPISAINVRPAEFCGYSSQELFGTLSGGPEETIDYADRVAHIWTNTANYLVAVHLQAPKDTAGFDDVKAMLMQDFQVVIP